LGGETDNGNIAKDFFSLHMVPREAKEKRLLLERGNQTII